MSTNAEKRERERCIIESARKHSNVFPPGTLVIADEPDGRIPSASLGIEVSELLPEKPDTAMFSGPQVAAFQSDVVQNAACLFSIRDARPVDVLVYFRNDWRRKRDPGAMARALAEFVADNYPTHSQTVVLQKGHHAIGWVDALSVVRITREDGRWQAGGCGDVVTLTYEQLACRIAAKNQRVQEYRRRLPGWQLWLLLATRSPVLHTVTVPRDVQAWQFTCDFDRVLLSSFEHGVLGLNCARPVVPHK